MLRWITATLLFAICPFVSSQTAQPARLVSLNAPGAMERIKAANPAHYEAIQGIVAGLARNPHATDPRWFTLDGTRYQGRVTLDSGRVYLVPTR